MAFFVCVQYVAHIGGIVALAYGALLRFLRLLLVWPALGIAAVAPQSPSGPPPVNRTSSAEIGRALWVDAATC